MSRMVTLDPWTIQRVDGKSYVRGRDKYRNKIIVDRFCWQGGYVDYRKNGGHTVVLELHCVYGVYRAYCKGYRKDWWRAVGEFS